MLCNNQRIQRPLFLLLRHIISSFLLLYNTDNVFIVRRESNHHRLFLGSLTQSCRSHLHLRDLDWDNQSNSNTAAYRRSQSIASSSRFDELFGWWSSSSPLFSSKIIICRQVKVIIPHNDHCLIRSHNQE